MEASALPSVGLARPRLGLGVPLLRLRSDEQLVSLFRAGHEEAFRVIHDRYRTRLFAYARQMLAGSSSDAEDAVQEIFVRAYAGLRSHNRDLALRAWLYRIAHNRCIDEIRRPQPLATETIEDLANSVAPDLVTRVEQRDALRRLIADVRRLPEQQRSALLMRELGGMPYADVSEALGVSVPAVKSLLVRARVGLAQAGEARDTACTRIREDLITSHDRGVRTSGLARRHMRDCPNCRQFRSEVRGVSRQFAALLPALGPIGIIAKLLGVGSAGGGGAAAGTGAVATSGAAGTGALASASAVVTGAGHVATLLAAVAVTAGGAIELQQTATPSSPAHHARVVNVAPRTSARATASAPSSVTSQPAASVSTQTSASQTPRAGSSTRSSGTAAQPSAARPRERTDVSGPLPLSELIDPDNLGSPPSSATPTSGTATGSPSATGAPTTTTPTDGSPTSTVPTSATTPPAAGTTGTAGTTTGTGSGTSGTTTSTTGTGSGTSGTTGTGTGTSSGTTGTSPTGSGSGTVVSGTPTGSAPTSSGTSSGSGGAAASGTTGTPTRAATVVSHISGS